MPPGPAHADWSPDGRRLAFQAGVEGSWDIWVSNADGSDAQVLVDCVSPCINLDAPAWSPDGTSIVYSALDELGQELPSHLVIIDVASRKIRMLASVDTGLQLTEPRWSPNGSQIVATLENHRPPDGYLVENPLSTELVTIRTAEREPALTRLGPEGINASYADWEPGGDRIVFQAGAMIWWSDIAESTSNLYVIRADGTDLVQLTDRSTDSDALWMPAWTGDGSAILATATVRESLENRLVLVAADGSTVTDTGLFGAHGRQQRRVTPP